MSHPDTRTTRGTAPIANGSVCSCSGVALREHDRVLRAVHRPSPIQQACRLGSLQSRNANQMLTQVVVAEQQVSWQLVPRAGCRVSLPSTGQGTLAQCGQRGLAVSEVCGQRGLPGNVLLPVRPTVKATPIGRIHAGPACWVAQTVASVQVAEAVCQREPANLHSATARRAGSRSATPASLRLVDVAPYHCMPSVAASFSLSKTSLPSATLPWSCPTLQCSIALASGDGHGKEKKRAWAVAVVEVGGLQRWRCCSATLDPCRGPAFPPSLGPGRG